ncbi:IQ calmodulin-binding motif-containing protein 1 [Patella vulgata]|uniref:IQ calmodulin-binding motif-containing protein 1 n=1 Tax=Patella vulgata TaxID=6465 RepID=UPI0024A7F6F0|nr:IQ calmodulin-binding motif-containing protein 1 [Patella vulgata]
MDELVYKLTVNNIIEVAAIATKCVLKVCDYHKGMVGALSTRYKGLRPLLGKWSGQGFDRDLKHLLTILETGSLHRAENEKFFDAAMVIQMMWRGFSTRKKLKKANTAFAKFQKNYRLKKKHVTMKKEEEKLAKEFERQFKENRLKIMREFHQKQLHTIEILPAAKVEQYLAKEKSVAAVKIQTLWRGKKERDLLPWRQQVRLQVRAAIRIQRYVRKWLDRRADKSKDISVSLKPPGLTDARRIELQTQIQEWRDLHPTHIKDREGLQEIHNRAAQLLAKHYLNIKTNRQKQHHLESLMARLDTDSDLVQLAPKLKDVTDKDVEMYTSRSVPVATKARLNHVETLRRLQKPWWKRLGEEDEDQFREEYQEMDEYLF